MGKPRKHYGRWRIRWTDENGKRHSQVFDDRDQAALELQRRKLEAVERKRGLRPGPPPLKKFSDAADYWEKNRVPFKRSGNSDLGILKQLRTAFGDLSLSDPTCWVPAIDMYKASKRHLNDKTLVNHLTLLGSIFRLSVDLGWMTKVPRIPKPKIRIISADYCYLRTEEEITKFLRSAKAEGEMVFVLYATAVFTGLRAGELAALRWDDVNFRQRLITVQRSFDGPTKSADVRYVPVVDALLPILERWRLKHPGKLVFTNHAGTMLGPCARIFQEVLHRVLRDAGFPKVERNGKLRPYIRFHDTRHTFASHWVMRGGDIFKLQKVLGHKSVTMTLRYAHLQPAAFREDYDRFSSVIDDVADVIPIRKSAGKR